MLLGRLRIGDLPFLMTIGLPTLKRLATLLFLVSFQSIEQLIIDNKIKMFNKKQKRLNKMSFVLLF